MLNWLIIINLLSTAYMYINLSVCSIDFIANITLVLSLLSIISFIKKYRRENVFCFELLFSIVFFFVTYSYYWLISSSESGLYIVNQIFNSIDFSFYKEGLCISNIGYCFFLIGTLLPMKRGKTILCKTTVYNLVNIEKICLFVFFIFTILFISFDLQAIISKYKIAVDGKNEISSLLFYNTIFAVLSTLLSLYNFKDSSSRKIKTFVKTHKLFSILYLFFILILFVSGYRSLFLMVFLPFYVGYTIFIKKISIKFVFLGSIVGFFTLLLVGLLRGGQEIGEDVDLYMALRDFVSGSLTLPFMIEQTKEVGYTWGSDKLLDMISFIPFFQGLLVAFGFEVSRSSSEFFTTGILGNNVYTGLGTSLPADLYYSFGLIGVVMGFFILGYLVSFLYKRIFIDKSQNMYVIIFYVYFMGFSLFIPRVEYFYIVRYIGFSILILYLFIFFTKAPKVFYYKSLLKK